jgi:parallel beta-helix repeat protein
MLAFLLTLTLSVSLNDLRAQPSAYSYPYYEGFITLSPIEDTFVAKFAADTPQTDALSQLQQMGMTLSTSVPTASGERLYLIRSSTKDLQRLQFIKRLPSVIWASPIFRYLDGKEQVVLNTFVVKFKSGISESEITRTNRAYGVSIEREDEFSPGGRRILLKHQWEDEVDVFKLAYQYSLLPSVEYASPDFIILDAFDADDWPDDPYYPDQWNLAKINAEGAWRVTKGSNSIKIAVVDDGVDLGHEDFVGKLVSGYDGVSNDTIPSPSGNDSHGTACAGVIGAAANNGKGVAGLAANCKVMPIRAGEGGSYYYWAATTGINWAVSHGADVISNSYGRGGPSQDFETAIANATVNGRGGKGCVVTFAAGNGGGAVEYPAYLSNVIAVGATDQSDDKWDYSATGSALDVVAPSGNTDWQGDIWTTDLTGAAGKSSSDYMSVFGGTSAACPLVAGLAGLILSKDNYLSRDQVTTIIQYTAKDLGASGRDDQYGWGRIDAAAALRITRSGVLPGNEVWRGNVNLSGNVTVPSGVTLVVLGGTTVNTTGNYYLHVEGCLVADGATFTRSDGQWVGIELYGASSNTHISNCTIENASCGVYVYGTSYFYIDRCTIQNNYTGIESRSSHHTISLNQITGNTYGVRCTDYSQLDFQLTNWVKFNSRGIDIDATSTPYLGTDQNRVYCSIWGNDWDVWSLYGGTVSAQWNYWGSYPANPMIYGTVDYSNELMVEPNPFLKIAVQKSPPRPASADQSTAVASDTLGMAELDHARALEGKAPSAEAQTALRSVITRYPNKTAGLIALAHVARLTEKDATDPTPLLLTYASEYSASPLGDFAEILMGQIKLRNGDTDGALALFEPLALAQGGLFEREALYNAGCLLWYRKGEKAEAEKYFRRLIEKWPDDTFSHSALATLGEPAPDKQLARGNEEAEGVPRVFGLSAPYPNPFNPTTTISYQLPTDGYVKLVVYDLLGRHIAELASGPHAAGRYSETWNASSLASGIYLARFVVVDEFGKERINKVVKIILTK